MKTKLTLRLYDKIIRRAKAHARKSGKSVSQIVSEYFEALGEGARSDEGLPPTTRSLLGSLAGAEVDKKQYQQYLEMKFR